MQNIEIPRSSINFDALNNQLRNVLGESFIGLSVQSGLVVVHLTDEASSADIQQVRSLVASHDPNVLTPKQEAENQRIQKLNQLRSDNSTELDPDDFSDESASIQSLVEKLRWLEAEMRDLRGTI